MSASFNDDSGRESTGSAGTNAKMTRDRLINMEEFRAVENSGSSAKESTRKFTLEQLAENASLVTPERLAVIEEKSGGPVKTKKMEFQKSETTLVTFD